MDQEVGVLISSNVDVICQVFDSFNTEEVNEFKNDLIDISKFLVDVLGEESVASVEDRKVVAEKMGKAGLLVHGVSDEISESSGTDLLSLSDDDIFAIMFYRKILSKIS